MRLKIPSPKNVKAGKNAGMVSLVISTGRWYKFHRFSYLNACPDNRSGPHHFD